MPKIVPVLPQSNEKTANIFQSMEKTHFKEGKKTIQNLQIDFHYAYKGLMAESQYFSWKILS